MIKLYRELPHSEWYYIEKDGYGNHIFKDSAMRTNIEWSLQQINIAIQSRKKSMLSSVPRRQGEFELIGEVECISDIIAILELLEV